jgi:PAS domain S-box-containing protein
MNAKTSHPGQGPEDKITGLVRTLHDTQRKLQKLTAGEVDAVVHPGGHAYLLHKAQERLQKSEAAQRQAAETQIAILNAMPAHIALVNPKGEIISVNDAWKNFASESVFQGSGFNVGQNYLDICDRVTGECYEQAHASAAGIRSVLQGENKSFSYEYPCHSPTERCWFRLVVTPVQNDHHIGAVIMHIDITEAKQNEEKLLWNKALLEAQVDSTLDGILIVDSAGQTILRNKRLIDMWGIPEAFALGSKKPLRLNLVTERVKNSEAFIQTVAHLYDHPDKINREEIELVDGTWLDRYSAPVRDHEGKHYGRIWTFRDITEHKLAELRLYRLNRLHMILSKVSEVILQTSERQALYDAVCRIVGEDGALGLVVIAEVDEATKLARPVAYHGGGTEYLREPASFVPTDGVPLGHGTVGTALRTGNIDVCNDIPGTPRMKPWHKITQKIGVFANASFPLKLRGATIGVLALFAGEKNFFQDDEIHLMTSVANAVSVALEGLEREQKRQCVEQALRQSEERLRLITDLVPHGIFAKDAAGRHIFANPALAEIAGLSVEEILGKDDFALVGNREEAARYREDDRAVMQSGKKMVIAEEKRTDLSGRTRFLQTIKVPFTVNGTSEPAVLGVCMDITERKQAEEVLQRQKTELQILFDLIPAMICFKDTENNFIRVNSRLAEASGKSVAQIEGKSAFDVFPNEAAGYHADDLEVIQSGKPKLGIVEKLQSRDGRELWVETDKVPVRDKDGKVIGIIALTEDITERKKAEQSLALFRALVDRSPDGIEIIDPETCRFLDVNETGWRRLGYSREEMLTLTVSDIDDSENHRAGWSAFVVDLKKTGSATLLGGHRRKDGSRFPVEINARYIDLNQGYVFAVVRDITERKKTEDRLRLLIDSNLQGVIFWDLNGGIKGANNAFLDLVGYTRDDLEKGLLNWEAMTPPEYAHLDRKCLDQIAATGTGMPYEKEFIRKDGARVPIYLGAASFADNPNEGICFVLDISERKKLENQFLRAQRMESIGTLAGGIAHDLNNILAPILMSIHILKATSPDAEAQDILETIEVSAKRGADIVRQVLSFARGIEGERIEIQTKHLLKDLEVIVKDTFPRNIRLQFAVPNNAWTILGDPTQVHQILLNLCVNARDAMEHGGSLIVAVKNVVLDEHYAAMNMQAKAGRFVNINVTDSGTGMPPELLEKIFEPFFTTKGVGKGTGLGLSTVAAIVKSHDGFINVYSEPEKGTTFKVYLPAMESTSDAPKSTTAEVAMPRGNGELVLLVDDEPSMRTITGQTLQSFGYRVLTATDGADAVAVYLAHRQEVAVVITDMMMPVMDGPAMIHALIRINPEIKIIATSGLSANGGLTKVSEVKIKHFLTKPYTAATLLKALRALLEENR